MYVLPAMLVYGVLTSILSDAAAHWLAARTTSKAEFIFSLLFHLLFGLILLWVSLTASLLFFLTDRLLMIRQKEYTGSHAYGSLTVSLILWLLFTSAAWISG